MAKDTKKTENIYDTSDRYENAHNSIVRETVMIYRKRRKHD